MKKKIISMTLIAGVAFCATSTSLLAQDAPISPVVMVDQFEATSGKFEGYRRSGAKGVCAIGEFKGSDAARDISTASAFSGNPIKVVVRFSVGGANPKAADNTKSQRNLSLEFKLPNGEVWQHGNISSPIFGSSTPQQLLGRLASLQPDPVTKVADPAKVKAFTDANPEVLLQGRYIAAQPVPASYASVNYWGVHGFIFTNSKGKETAGKWVFEPVKGVKGLTDDEAKTKGASFLFDDIRQRVQQGDASFNFNLELAEPGDVINKATVALPEGRKKITLGVLRVTSVSADGGGECLNLNFDPNRMPKGIKGTNDPMLTGRTTPYAVSLGRRLTEGSKQQ